MGGAWLSAMWPSEVQDAIWTDDPDALICGTGIPSARATAAQGGYHIQGAWPWASNCDNSRWAYLSCLLPEAEGGVGWFLVPMDDLSLNHDSWDVAGQRGTGSTPLRRGNPLFVPSSFMLRVADAVTGRSAGRSIPGNVTADYLFPTFGGTALVAPLIGMARGALTDFVETAKTKRRMTGLGQSVPVAHDPEVQAAIGEAWAAIDAAYLLSLDEIERAEALIRGGKTLEQEARLRIRRNTGFIARSTTRVINRLLELSGASAMAMEARMQRFWRDANFAARHVSLNVRQGYSMAGQGLLGIAPEGAY